MKASSPRASARAEKHRGGVGVERNLGEAGGGEGLASRARVLQDGRRLQEVLDRGGELREHRGGEAVHLGLDGGELGLERRGEGRGEVRGGLGHHAELIVVVGAGEVAEDLDSFGEEEAELVEVELSRGVDVETDEDGLEVLHAGGGGGLLGNAEDARELLVLGEAPGDLGEGHGAGVVRIALVEDAPDLGLLLV